PYVLTTDEIYGTLLNAFTFPSNTSGCPWGWVHLIDIRNPAKPKVVGQYQTAENRPGFCDTPAGLDPANTTFTSYASHNPTVLGSLAFVTWHSNGLQAISIANPAS